MRRLGQKLAYDLLLNECMLRHVIREAGPERDGVRVHIQTGLNEGYRGILHVKLVPSRKRVLHSIHAERLQRANA